MISFILLNPRESLCSSGAWNKQFVDEMNSRPFCMINEYSDSCDDGTGEKCAACNRKSGQSLFHTPLSLLVYMGYEELLSIIIDMMVFYRSAVFQDVFVWPKIQCTAVVERCQMGQRATSYYVLLCPRRPRRVC